MPRSRRASTALIRSSFLRPNGIDSFSNRNCTSGVLRCASQERRPPRAKPRPARWAAALAELRALAGRIRGLSSCPAVSAETERPAHDAHAGTMGESDLMLDTHAVARSLTAADFTPAQADAPPWARR